MRTGKCVTCRRFRRLYFTRKGKRCACRWGHCAHPLFGNVRRNCGDSCPDWQAIPPEGAK